MLNSSLQFLNFSNPRLNIAFKQLYQRTGFFDSFKRFYEIVKYYAGLNLLPDFKSDLLSAERLIRGKCLFTIRKQCHGTIRKS